MSAFGTKQSTATPLDTVCARNGYSINVSIQMNDDNIIYYD